MEELTRLFEHQMDPSALAALRALFKLDNTEADAVEEALIEHGGGAAVELLILMLLLQLLLLAEELLLALPTLVLLMQLPRLSDPLHTVSPEQFLVSNDSTTTAFICSPACD